ncbi:MAG: DNA polymerase/3'-5' exonuclease PolX [Gemmatimonadales bacterium]|nr:MAG: DNA polymerase/3'-5' exonuclease PolX [Gemmatimonadales bacterium]
MENPAIADQFDEMADLLELDGANVFRVRAYRNAARVIRDLGTPLRDLAHDPKALVELPGIGTDLAAKIREILETGTFKALAELRSKFPAGLLELTRLPGLGPKRVRLLHDTLGIASLGDLRRALEEGRLEGVRGFGERSVRKLKEELDRAATRGEKRMLLAEAEKWVNALLEHLRAGGFDTVEAAGSYRRRKETVGDLDLLVATTEGPRAIERFVSYSGVEEILAQGPTKASVRLRGGPQADLRVVHPDEYGAALCYFTGSKAHNVELRKIAQALDLKLNEYGVFSGERRVAGRTEEEVYEALGLEWIPPELREARGEIELAKRRSLPQLVELRDVRGDLHAHTNATDGKATLEEMAAAARNLGHRYLAITDHSKRVTMARGLDAERLRMQWREIDRINREAGGLILLKGVELDVLEDGELDLPDDVLAEADYVVASLHYGASRDPRENTRRLLRAVMHPLVDAIAHPTGRLLNRREPYPLDFEELARACAAEGCLLELNGSPERMDLPDHLAMAAAEEGVRFVLGTDSHAVSHLGYMSYAVAIARRAGLTKDRIVNCLDLEGLRRSLKRSAYRPIQ